MSTEPGTPILRAKLAGMDCGSCALTIEDGLSKVPGVRRVSVDFTTETLEVEGTASRTQLEHRLRQLGYRFQDSESSGAGAGAGPKGAAVGFFGFLWDSLQQRVALVTTGIIAIAYAVSSAASNTPPAEFILRVILCAAVVVVGAPIFVKGIRALAFSRRVTIELLMTVASLGAVLIGELG